MLKEYFKIAVKNLRTRWLRSWLTILGMAIGVFLIISLVSLSEGMKGAILKQLKMMGNDLIMVMPGELTNMATAMIGGMELDKGDMDAIKKADGVKSVAATSYQAETVRYGGDKKTVLIYGVSWRDSLSIFRDDMGWSLSEGRWPSPGKKEVIFGNLVRKEIFPEARVGDNVVIKGRQLEIVGILKSIGSKEDDTMIALGMDIFSDITGRQEGAQMAIVKVAAGYNPDEVVEHIKNELNETRERRRGEDLPPFSVLSSEKITGIVGNIVGLVQSLIFGLASIAIIVSGIGIMNTMYTAIYERTREIGILKAVGAKSTNITTIFLIESGIIGMIGGIGGVVLGVALAKGTEFALRNNSALYIEASVTPVLILFGLSFSFVVGCVAGFLPARKAAKLKPVDALRYE